MLVNCENRVEQPSDSDRLGDRAAEEKAKEAAMAAD